MRKLITLLTLACVQCGPVPVHAIELVDGKVVMTPKEMEQLQSCKALGGCFVVTQAGLEAMVDKTIEVTLVEVEKSAPICKRGLST